MRSEENNWLCFPRNLIRSFGKDDGNEWRQKSNRFITQNNFARASRFLYISLPSLHDYDVKMPNCKFYGGRKQATTNLFFSL